MKTVLVHDYLNQAGWADRVMKALRELFLFLPIYTSVVIYPTVDTSFFKPYNTKIKDHFFVVSRLNPFMHIGLVVRALNILKLPLIVIGKSLRTSSYSI